MFLHLHHKPQRCLFLRRIPRTETGHEEREYDEAHVETIFREDGADGVQDLAAAGGDLRDGGGEGRGELSRVHAGVGVEYADAEEEVGL